jgi:hypothetical protein
MWTLINASANVAPSTATEFLSQSRGEFRLRIPHRLIAELRPVQQAGAALVDCLHGTRGSGTGDIPEPCAPAAPSQSPNRSPSTASPSAPVSASLILVLRYFWCWPYHLTLFLVLRLSPADSRDRLHNQRPTQPQVRGVPFGPDHPANGFLFHAETQKAFRSQKAPISGWAMLGRP